MKLDEKTNNLFSLDTNTRTTFHSRKSIDHIEHSASNQIK